MKNRLTKLCMLAMLIAAGICPAVAADFMVDNIYYNVIGENMVEVTRGDVQYAGEVMIPSTVEFDGTTYQVTRIGNYAFYTSNMTLVDIPEGITHIGVEAFSFCRQLESVEFPNSLVCLEDFAFATCINLKEIYIPRNLIEISPWAFSRCYGVTTFMCSAWNPNYKSVDGVLFNKDMTELYVYPPASLGTSYDIPPTVTVIQPHAFNDADNLVNVTIPESVTWIGAGAFEYSDNIVSLDFPDGVTFIGPSGFYGCDKLSSVHLPANLDTIRNSLGAELPSLTELFIPRSVKYISDYAFVESTGIKTVIFEEGSCLQGIGLRAFDGLTALESFDMPNTVTMMGGQVFGNCTSLKEIHLSDNLQELGNSTFWKCSSLIECEVPGSVPVIGNLCNHCTSLKRAIIGDKNSVPGTTIIKNAAIASCPQLEYLEFGANVDSLTHLSINDLDNLKVFICWATTPPRCTNYMSSFGPSPDKLTATLYVPKESIEAYRTARDWCDFNHIVAIEDVGDVDGDGSILISDVTELIDQMLNGEVENPAFADVDFDGYITISDVTDLIDRILNGN